MKARMLFCVLVTAIYLTFVLPVSAQSNSCTSFTVIVEDRLHNVNQGLSSDDLKWWDKLAKKYPAACYVSPGPNIPVVFYIRVTPDTYHGTRVITDTDTQTSPIRGTVTDQNGNDSDIRATVETTTTTSTAVPYSFEYGIFTLSVQLKQHDGSYLVLHTFQQKGLYYTYMYIPLGGRGHHPAHAVIEDAAKWVNSGGLTNPNQGSLVSAASAPANPPQTVASGIDITDVEDLANRGDATAQFNLGVLYHDGEGVPQNYTQAAVWFRKAAEKGNADAQYSLGVLYDLGHGVPNDYAQADILFRKAADQGHARAQYNLAYAYRHGQGVEQDSVEAAVWYRKAADQGHAGAQYSLGVLYRDGTGVPQDYAQAVAWTRKAAEQGDAAAQDNLGLFYDHGQGVTQDHAQAAIWYRKATELGDAHAQFNLAYAYALGQGVTQDDAQSATLFRMAAEQGYARAQFNLGMLYDNGQGVPKDYAQAYFWFDLAAAGGGTGDQQVQATKFRDETASHLSPTDLSQMQARASKWFAEHPAKP